MNSPRFFPVDDDDDDNSLTVDLTGERPAIDSCKSRAVSVITRSHGMCTLCVWVPELE